MKGGVTSSDGNRTMKVPLLLLSFAAAVAAASAIPVQSDQMPPASTLPPVALEPSPPDDGGKVQFHPPTSRPTVSDKSNGFLVVRVDSKLGVSNLDPSEIPDPPYAFNRALSNSIRMYHPPDTQILDLNVVALGGRRLYNRLFNRLLQTGDAEVTYEAVLFIDCEDVVCSNADERAAASFASLLERMNAAVNDGSLTMTIQEQAMAENVPALANVQVTDYVAEEPIVSITEGAGGGGTSAAGPQANYGRGYTAAAATLLGLFAAFV